MEVEAFAYVVFELEQQRVFWAGGEASVSTLDLLHDTDYQLPGALADGDGPVAVVGVCVNKFRHGRGLRRVREEAADVAAIDAAIGRKRFSSEGEDGGKDVESAGRILEAGGRDDAGEVEDAGDAGTAFPIGTLAVAEGQGVTDVEGILESDPWTIVGREDEEGVALDTGLDESLLKLGDAVINFEHDVAEEAAAGFVLEIVAAEEAEVGHVESDVGEEGLVAVFGDEVAGSLGAEAGQRFTDIAVLRQVAGEDAVALGRLRAGGIRFDQHGIGVVVADVGADPSVEAMGEGEGVWGEFVLVVGVAEVPFAEHAGGIAARLESFGKSGFLGVEVDLAIRADDVEAEAGAAGNAAGEQPVARGGAGRGGTVELREAGAIGDEATDRRSGDGRVAIVLEVAVAGIVEEDDDDVGAVKRGTRGRLGGRVGFAGSGDAGAGEE